jgi:hypothetical protein
LEEDTLFDTSILTVALAKSRTPLAFSSHDSDCDHDASSSMIIIIMIMMMIIMIMIMIMMKVLHDHRGDVKGPCCLPY